MKWAKKPDSVFQTSFDIYKEAFKAIRENPTIPFLFFLIALLDFTALFVLFMAPNEPFSYFLAPIIRTFWDERYLHYPDNFLLLPKLVMHAHFLILSVFGILITGIAIKKIEAYRRGKNLAIVSALHPVLRKYFSLLVAWLFSYWFFSYSSKWILNWMPATSIDLSLAVGFLLALVIQSLTAFLMPALMISDRGFFVTVLQALKNGARYLKTTAVLIFLPVLAVVLFSFLKAIAPVLVQSHPEMVLWVLGIGVLVSMVADLIVTSTTTLLYLDFGEKGL